MRPRHATAAVRMKDVNGKLKVGKCRHVAVSAIGSSVRLLLPDRGKVSESAE